MITKPLRLVTAMLATSAVVFTSAAAAGAADHASAHRLTGNGQRNHEFLTVDVSINGSNVSGVVALGYVNGSEVCTYRTFANGSINGTAAAFDATGWCTANKPGFSHVSAHHRIGVVDSPTGDTIDVNSLPDSESGITIPGGALTAGQYYLH